MRNINTMQRRLKRRFSDSVANADTTRLQRLQKNFKTSVSFMSLLGVTWLFGALAIGDAALHLQYIFVICNSIQARQPLD